MKPSVLSSLAAALLAALPLIGCTGARSQLGPREAGSGWWAVETEHFRIRTNLEASRAAELARQLERQRAGLAAFIGVAPSSQVEVIHFRSQKDFEHFQPGEVSGFATAFQGRPLLVTVEDEFMRGTDHLTSISAHEVAHHLYSHVLVRAPRWLSEGLATYLETLKVEGNRAVVGQPPYLRYLQVRDEGPMAIEELFTWDLAKAEPHRGARLYASAWAWVHFLRTEHRTRFEALLQRLATGEEPRQAWESAFGELDAAKLRTKLRGYVFEVMRTVEVAIPSALPVPAVRPLTGAEVHVVFGQTWLLTPSALTRQERSSRALAEIRLAREKDARLYSAVALEYALTRGAEREAVTATLLADFPGEAETWLLAADRHLQHGAVKEAGVALERALALAPEDVRVQSTAARYFARDPKLAARALRLAEAAFAQAPWSGEVNHTLALAQSMNGLCDRFEQTAQRTLLLMAETTPVAEQQTLLAELQDRANRCRPLAGASSATAKRLVLPKAPAAPPDPPGAAAGSEAPVSITPPPEPLTPLAQGSEWGRTARTNAWFFAVASGVTAVAGGITLAAAIGNHQYVRGATAEEPLLRVAESATLAHNLYPASAVLWSVAAGCAAFSAFQFSVANDQGRLAITVGPGGVVLSGVLP